MDFEEVREQLQLGEGAERLRVGWEESQRALPAELDFLKPDFVRWACGEVGLRPELTEAAARVSGRIMKSEALQRLAWHMRYRVFVTEEASWQDIDSWPLPQAALGADAGYLCLVVLLSNVPQMQEQHRLHQVPTEVVRDTLTDLSFWVKPEGDGSGLCVNLPWLRYHLSGQIYRLGRLQFQFGEFDLPVRVYRNRGTGVVVALSEAGIDYTPEGHVPHREDQERWTADLTIGDDEARGYPIHPEGYAVHREVRLALSEWRQDLAPGDPVLKIHIPGGEPLGHEACGRAFQRAMKFFPRHYPKYRFVGFRCHSWLLNTWLAEVLPPDSNLVRFQREFYLVPTEQWPPSMFKRVFNSATVDPATAPRDTRLRRAIVEALERGEDLYGGGGGMFLLSRDLNWGAEVYRSQPWPW